MKIIDICHVVFCSYLILTRILSNFDDSQCFRLILVLFNYIYYLKSSNFYILWWTFKVSLLNSIFLILHFDRFLFWRLIHRVIYKTYYLDIWTVVWFITNTVGIILEIQVSSIMSYVCACVCVGMYLCVVFSWWTKIINSLFSLCV